MLQNLSFSYLKSFDYVIDVSNVVIVFKTDVLNGKVVKIYCNFVALNSGSCVKPSGVRFVRRLGYYIIINVAVVTDSNLLGIC